MKIICIVGKSSSGKDSIYKRVIEYFTDRLKPIVTYTTRDMRTGEVDGKEYHFVSEEVFNKHLSEGRVVESRVYSSFGRNLTYYTCLDGIEDDGVYLVVSSLAQLNRYSDFFGVRSVYPIYVEVDDGELLRRAICRCERTDGNYKEVCRRFLSDADEWENTSFAKGLSVKVIRNDSLEKCISDVVGYIEGVLANE